MGIRQYEVKGLKVVTLTELAIYVRYVVSSWGTWRGKGQDGLILEILDSYGWYGFVQSQVALRAPIAYPKAGTPPGSLLYVLE